MISDALTFQSLLKNHERATTELLLRSFMDIYGSIWQFDFEFLCLRGLLHFEGADLSKAQKEKVEPLERKLQDMSRNWE